MLHVVLCYAPMRAASRQVKDAFYQDLESILAAILTEEKYVTFGDFNAHVGSRESVGVSERATWVWSHQRRW